MMCGHPVSAPHDAGAAGILGRLLDTPRLFGRLLDSAGVLGRDLDSFGPWSVRIPPESAPSVRESPENAASVRIPPGNALKRGHLVSALHAPAPLLCRASSPQASARYSSMLLKRSTKSLQSVASRRESTFSGFIRMLTRGSKSSLNVARCPRLKASKSTSDT